MRNDLRYSLDCGKARDQLGYAPQVPFDAGLLATVAWYRENRYRWQPLEPQVPVLG